MLARVVLVIPWLWCATTFAQSVERFDFQPAGAPLEPGFTEVTPATAYDAGTGYGFTAAPRAGTDGHGLTFANGTMSVDDAIPDPLRSDATLDAVVHGRPYTFRVDVAPGTYDVTVWVGDVTTPTHEDGRPRRRRCHPRGHRDQQHCHRLDRRRRPRPAAPDDHRPRPRGRPAGHEHRGRGAQPSGRRRRLRLAAAALRRRRRPRC
jgi:hypothetical protein